jgi:hypothetical protein
VGGYAFLRALHSGWAGWLAGWLADPILSLAQIGGNLCTFHLLLCFVSLWWRDDTPW